MKNTVVRLPLLGDIVEARRLWRARRSTGYIMESVPGHFGSPIPALNEIRAREDQIFVVPRSIPGVELNDRAQLDLIVEFAELYQDQPFGKEPQVGLRYHFENSLFSYGDALMLHCILRRYRPRRLIEVGSGFSSAVILDTNDRFLDGSLSCTFVDPFPRRLQGLLREGDDRRHRIVMTPVQQVPLELFDELDEGDVLFVDSTHVSKVGSDVNRLLFDVLPRLKAGVLVHFHDIFYPFEYPREWIYRGRAWNENYLLRAFLAFNGRFAVLLFNWSVRNSTRLKLPQSCLYGQRSLAGHFGSVAPGSRGSSSGSGSVRPGTTCHRLSMGWVLDRWLGQLRAPVERPGASMGQQWLRPAGQRLSNQIAW